MRLQLEEWKVHPKLHDYSISTLGRVRRVTPKRGTVVGKVLVPAVGKNGYAFVNLGGRTRAIHVLVLETFIGLRPSDAQARHLNDNKLDCRLENLSWGSRSENYADRVRNGGGNHGSRHGLSRLTERQVREIRSSYRPYVVSMAQLANKYGVSHWTIKDVISRKNWRHI